ncbi:MAG TPA: hypothetical protein VFK76_06770 [Gaiellaceae bacterium]|nr:hypothetical protein [Gaiellaceae bacterium]
MKSNISFVIAVACAVLALAVPAAWAALTRDAGDATTARLGLESSPVVIRDAGDAAGARVGRRPFAVVSRDAGDATSARLKLESSSVVVRDAGDATAARVSQASKESAGSGLEWKIAPAFGLAFAALVAVFAAGRLARTRRLAH